MLGFELEGKGWGVRGRVAVVKKQPLRRSGENPSGSVAGKCSVLIRNQLVLAFGPPLALEDAETLNPRP